MPRCQLDGLHKLRLSPRAPMLAPENFIVLTPLTPKTSCSPNKYQGDTTCGLPHTSPHSPDLDHPCDRLALASTVVDAQTPKIRSRARSTRRILCSMVSRPIFRNSMSRGCCLLGRLIGLRPRKSKMQNDVRRVQSG